jgi:Outer membrane efflux protein/HupE / UreJ protein
LLDVRQAEQLVFTAGAEIPVLEQQIEQQENFLSILLGQNPGDIPRGQTLTEQHQPPEVPPGLPSSLLERRPDIQQAEAQLVAANAEIGVARAAYFPQISLNGAGGFQSSALTGLFTGPAGAWSFGASLTQPIFTGGRIRSQVRLAEARRQTAVLFYQQSIQGAFRGVSDALVAYSVREDSDRGLPGPRAARFGAAARLEGSAQVAREQRWPRRLRRVCRGCFAAGGRNFLPTDAWPSCLQGCVKLKPRCSDPTSYFYRLRFSYFWPWGAGLGYFGFQLRFAETAIAMSCLVLGSCILWSRLQKYRRSIFGIVAGFATVHGYVHLVELPAGFSASQFTFGFLSASAIMHITGVFIGEAFKDKEHLWLMHIFGSAMSVCGVLFLIRSF